MTKEVLKLALEALTRWAPPFYAGKDARMAEKAITAIKQALAAPVQEPTVWVRPNGINNSGVAHYGPTCPPGWVGAATAYFKAPAQPAPVQDIDWKDQYEKQKRRADMWMAKYEKDIGPLEYAAPAAPVQEN